MLPEHFQSVLGFIGILLSIGLTVALYDMLLNPNFGIYRLLIFGLTFCLLITMVNLASASTVLLRPVTREIYPEKTNKWDDAIKTPARTIRTGDYEYNREMLVDNQIVAAAILGFGFVLSVIFIFLTMIRSIGNSFLLKMLMSRLLSLIAKIGHLCKGGIQSKKNKKMQKILHLGFLIPPPPKCRKIQPIFFKLLASF